MVRYKSIAPIDFYVLYNVLRLYFIKGYDIKKYGLYSKRIAAKYNNDRLKSVYDYIAQKIPNKQQAIFHICANFINDRNNFITQFDLNVCYNKDLNRYCSNNLAIVDDFEQYCKSHDIIKKINSGELANDVIIRKEYLVLFAYVNKVVPLVTLSKNNISMPKVVLDLFFESNADDKKLDDSLFDKILFFINIADEHKANIENQIFDILKNERLIT